MMKNLLAFLRSRTFFLNFAIILVIIFLGFFAVVHWLSSYTGHGEFVTVPEFTGKRVVELDTNHADNGVAFKIIDSIYDPQEKPGIVLRQDPEAGTKVKYNRTVYLYVTGMVAPQVNMPKLVDRSERQARLVLRSYGLKAGHITVKKADCDGCVLSQLVHGHEIVPGKPVKKGTAIDLIVGSTSGPIEADTTAVDE